MEKVKTWEIDTTDSQGNFIKIGEFKGTQEGFDTIKQSIELYLDTEDGRDQSFRYTAIQYDKVLLKAMADIQTNIYDEAGLLDSMIEFEYEGTSIINPFYDESLRFDVDPIEYYGKAFLESEWRVYFNLKEVI